MPTIRCMTHSFTSGQPDPVVTPNLGFMDKLVAYEDTGIFKTISLGRNRHVVLDEYENGLVTIRASLTT